MEFWSGSSKGNGMVDSVEIFISGKEGKSDSFLSPKSSRNSFVVPSKLGFPGTSLIPTTFIHPFSNKFLIKLLLTETPLTYSISLLVMGCL